MRRVLRAGPPVGLLLLTASLPAGAQAQGTTPFRLCVERAIVQLDDFISPADVIAAGAVENCRDALSARMAGLSPEGQNQFITGLKQRAIPEVLRFRSTGRTTNTR